MADKEFERIYLLYYYRMKRFAQEYVVLEEDAENILQDVFLDFWEKRAEYLSYDNPLAYLFTSIKNRCIDCLRRRMLEQEAVRHLKEAHLLTLQMNLNSLEALKPDLINEDLEGMVTRAIQALPEKCREIFVKSKIEGMKQKAIADELNISINTVETQMKIAYKKLKEHLKEYYFLLLF